MTETSGANVLIAIPGATEHLAELREAMPGIVIDAIEPYPPGGSLPTETIRDRTVLVADFLPANVAEMPQLEWLQLGSAGYMQLSGQPVSDTGVRVTNASGVNDIPIAEWCVMLMLAFERAFPEMLGDQAHHRWNRAARFQSELRGRRVGIIGYGNIGREVAHLSRAMGLEVWAMNRRPIGPAPLKHVQANSGDPEGTLPKRTFTLDQMDEFLPHLDYLMLTAALNPATHGLIGARELQLLPPHAVVLNPARAQLIDEAALHQALRKGWIAGLGIDSHYREPMAADDPTWDLPNVIATSHISGSTASPNYAARLWDLVEQNLRRHLNGEPLLNEISWSDINRPA